MILRQKKQKKQKNRDHCDVALKKVDTERQHNQQARAFSRASSDRSVCAESHLLYCGTQQEHQMVTNKEAIIIYMLWSTALKMK